MLTEYRKSKRIRISLEHLNRNDGNLLEHLLITGDEAWVHYSTPYCKRASARSGSHPRIRTSPKERKKSQTHGFQNEEEMPSTPMENALRISDVALSSHPVVGKNA